MASLIGRKLLSDASISVVCRKINIVQKRLDVESGPPYDDWDMPVVADALHGAFGHLLETDYMEFFIRLQHIYKIVRDPSHLFRPYLRRADIHIFVNLHGIR